MSNNTIFPFDPSLLHAEDIEIAVLGAALVDNKYCSKLIERIRSKEVFYNQSFQLVYQAIAETIQKHGECDVLLVGEWLASQGRKDLVSTLSLLISRFAFGGDVEKHCIVLLEYFVKRLTVFAAAEMLKKAHDPHSDIFDTLNWSKQKLEKISDQIITKPIRTDKAIFAEMLLTIRQRMTNPDLFLGLDMPVDDLYHCFWGWNKQDLTIIAARPGMGKTAVLIACTFSILIAESKVAIFSLEMSAAQLAQRMVTLAVRVATGQSITNHNLRGNLSEADYRLIENAANDLSKERMYIDDTAALPLDELEMKATIAVVKHKCEIIFVDYLQLLKHKSASRYDEISEIVRRLKNLAKKLDVPIVALSQLSRAVEGRSDKKPQLSDLRESGEIEQAADNVIMLYRPAYYNIEFDETGEDVRRLLVLDVKKQRNGKTGEIKAYCEIETNFLANWPYAPIPNPAANESRAPLQITPNYDFYDQ